MLDLYVDADACPVKPEIYRVAERLQLRVFVVSNRPMQVPFAGGRVQKVTVSGDFDAADDWIAKTIGEGDLCITADIPLAARCLERGAEVLGPRGQPFSSDSIGDALATRELMATLRETGALTGGEPPFNQKDRSRFLNALDQIIQRLKRSHRVPSP